MGGNFDSDHFHGTNGSPQRRLDFGNRPGGGGLPPDPRSASPQTIQLPTGRPQLMHLFREAPGHLPFSEDNVARIKSLIADSSCMVGTDTLNGNQWYSRVEPDGTQLWAKVHSGVVSNCGINENPRLWDPETGFDANPKLRNPKKRK